MKFKDSYSVKKSYDNFVVVTHGEDGYKKYRIQANNSNHAYEIADKMFEHLWATHGLIIFECDRYGNAVHKDIEFESAAYENGWTP